MKLEKGGGFNDDAGTRKFVGRKSVVSARKNLSMGVSGGH